MSLSFSASGRLKSQAESLCSPSMLELSTQHLLVSTDFFTLAEGVRTARSSLRESLILSQGQVQDLEPITEVPSLMQALLISSNNFQVFFFPGLYWAVPPHKMPVSSTH